MQLAVGLSSDTYSSIPLSLTVDPTGKSYLSPRSRDLFLYFLQFLLNLTVSSHIFPVSLRSMVISKTSFSLGSSMFIAHLLSFCCLILISVSRQ